MTNIKKSITKVKDSLLLKIVVITTGIILVSGLSAVKAQMTAESLRAHWITIIAEFIKWPAGVDTSKIIIGIYGTNAEEVIPLKEITNGKKIQNKPVEIINITKIKDIKDIHILFINNKYTDDIPYIYEKIYNKPILTITDRYKVQDYFMVNLLLLGKDKQFEINSKIALDANIEINEKLLARGGTKVDLQGLYAKKERELAEKERELQAQETELNNKEDQLKIQVSENQKQKEQNRIQAFELEKKEREIESEKAKAALLFNEVANQEIKLKANLKILAKQESEIKDKQALIEKANQDIVEKEKVLVERESKIKNQEVALNQQSIVIEQQKIIIYGAIISGIIFFILMVVIAYGYRARKKANQALTRKNEEINQQKEEIAAQAEQLELANHELEKLSIVASKTHNAVTIMDRNGYFEWVNVGFTKLYGYTLQLLRNERDENIVNVSSNRSIRNILHQCVNNKQTVVYEAFNNTREGKSIWVQTTLTPILDEQQNVMRLVAIDSDITKLKEQEQAIIQQREELLVQKDELIIQKEQIEDQNKHIKSSIKYALTIQKVILPLERVIEKSFDFFVIFKPKDIVSGDFYWFTHYEDTAANLEYTFMAAVDCTGHGVPGAFMSLIGNRLLNEIVVEKKIIAPAAILERLNSSIVKTLKQDQTDNNDGMDLCMVRLEKGEDNKYNVMFSGAKRPLYYHKIDENKTNFLKGDRKSIGGVRSRRSTVTFTNQEMEFNQGDILYMTTDGMVDQNGPDRKRFGSEKFFDLLQVIGSKPLKEQKMILESELSSFQKEEEQRDDITVFSIKLR